MKVTIYGVSDDLIEVDGDLEEEFTASDNDPNVLVFSDGTVLTVTYSPEGIWRVNRLHRGLGTAYERIESPTDDDDNYSDRVTLDGDLQWVTFGHSWNPIPRRTVRNERSA